MNMPVAEVESIVSGSPKSNGVSASFVRLTETMGVKFWYSEDIRDDVYRLQAAAAELGVGPKVGDKVEFVEPGYGKRYGYFTEVAKTVMDIFAGEHDTDKNGVWKDDDLHDEYIKRTHDIQATSEYAEMMGKILSIGMRFNDNHGQNFGYLPDGRMVVIDFGED